ncbi:hypothetical protein PsAD26_04616 [Pseudovibrio sp. Ad26]|nr:hypothetical protein PsAD26_04616 [Pseudovibrio sp. Ad26]
MRTPRQAFGGIYLDMCEHRMRLLTNCRYSWLSLIAVTIETLQLTVWCVDNKGDAQDT